MKKLSLISLGLALALCVTGCGRPGTSSSQAPAQSASATAAPQPAPAPDTAADAEAADPLAEMRQMAADNGYQCCILYLGGTVEEDVRALLGEPGTLDDAFLYDIPEERWVVAPGGGYEHYCIFPVDPGASVAVNEWVVSEANGYAGEPGRVLYRSDSGEPFLLQCNISDVMPNAQVVIVDSAGNTLDWSPQLSLRDGTLCFAPGVADFTAYDPQDPEDLLYAWEDQLPGPLALEGNWHAIARLTADGVEEIPLQDADTILFYPGHEPEGENDLPLTATYAEGETAVVIDSVVQFCEGPLQDDFADNELWHVAFGTENGGAYRAALINWNILVLRREMPGAADDGTLLYFEREAAMG